MDGKANRATREAAQLREGEKGAVDPLVIPGESVRQEIIDHFFAELDHNEKWVLLHKKAGEHGAAQRRREHCEKLLRFLEWLHLQAEVANVLREAVDPLNSDAVHCQKGAISEAWSGKHCCCRECIRERANMLLDGPALAKKPRTRFCWLCSRQLQGNHHIEMVIDGHPRILHKDCGKRAKAGLAEEG